MSDKQIVSRNDILNKIRKSASETSENLIVLANRGFNISDDLPANVKIIYPPFIKGKQQFLEHDAVSAKVVANARIQIERVIGRIKEFKILKNIVPLDYARCC